MRFCHCHVVFEKGLEKNTSNFGEFKLQILSVNYRNLQCIYLNSSKLQIPAKKRVQNWYRNLQFPLYMQIKLSHEILIFVSILLCGVSIWRYWCAEFFYMKKSERKTFCFFTSCHSNQNGQFYQFFNIFTNFFEFHQPGV